MRLPSWIAPLLPVSGCAMILLSLGGCGHALPGPSFCRIYQPVTTSAADSEPTRRQVDGNNAVWLALCGEPGADT